MNDRDELIDFIEKSNGTNTSDYVLKSYSRFLSILDSPLYFVDWDKYAQINKFFSLFKHYTGKSNGKPFLLEMWQKFIILNIFCVYNKNTGLRKHQTSYIQVARKNGKSALSSIMALYALLADGEANAQVILSANSKEQADIVFKMCDQFISQVVKKNIKKYRTSKIFYNDINELFVISSDASLQDGLNPSFAICDEMHEAKNDGIWQVLKSGMGMRENPHLLTITTAGFNKNSACYGLSQYSIDVINDIQRDDSLFSMIFEISEEDDFRDDKTWIKANPNLGVTVNRSWLETQIKQAESDAMMTTPILTKNLNKWVDSKTIWIPEKKIIDCFIPLEDYHSILRREEQILYAGVDLSAVCDLTAASFLFQYNGVLYFNIEYFLPTDFKGFLENRAKYIEWGRQKHIHMTPGNVTDYDYVLKTILDYMEIGSLFKCFYDAYNATQFVTTATNVGVPMEPYSQTIGAFNRPTKELERLILNGGKVKFVSSPSTLFCFRNTTLKYDYNNNCKPVKGGGTDLSLKPI